MQTFKVLVSVSLQPGILDPKGKATRSALIQLGYEGVKEVRMNKSMLLTIEAKDEQEALHVAEQSAKKLLANPVTESFQLSLQ